MARKNVLTSSPPYPVEQAIRRLGANLRTARLRRNLSIEDVAQKIGTGRRAVLEAEKGKASTSAAVYTALLWAYDLLTPMETLADPTSDREGIALSAQRERARGSTPKELDSDF
ncbi:MAG: family transcriptional regulator [Burkholderiales bacterium]|jgi:transcriptional regulator with XRE-family HTH domain|nr:family transcriptional regulator [Burkholderiales bacterium]